MIYFSPSKHLKLFFAIILLISTTSYAQTIPHNEPNEKLALFFSAVNDSIPVDVITFSSLQTATPGKNFTANVGGNLVIDGSLISTSGKFNNSVLTSIISLNGYIRTLFVFSKILLASGKIIFRGRITSPLSGDCFELLEKNDHYYFMKKNINQLRAE